MTVFNEVINDLYARTKAGEAALVDRQSRMTLIDEAIEAHFAQTGKMPESAELDRLATLILREELTSMDPHKVKHEEAPILSERQQERRDKGELRIDVTMTRGIDGKDYRRPVRKK